MVVFLLHVLVSAFFVTIYPHTANYYCSSLSNSTADFLCGAQVLCGIKQNSHKATKTHKAIGEPRC
jgi:hypothetical protein